MARLDQTRAVWLQGTQIAAQRLKVGLALHLISVFTETMVIRARGRMIECEFRVAACSHSSQIPSVLLATHPLAWYRSFPRRTHLTHGDCDVQMRRAELLCCRDRHNRLCRHTTTTTSA
jgi:hypothetical protein